MKFNKILIHSFLSLFIMTSSLVAFDFNNTKATGESVFYYQTFDRNSKDLGFFNKGDNSTPHNQLSMGSFGVSIKFEITSHYDTTFVAKLNALETLGAENSLVLNTIQNIDPDDPSNKFYFGEAYLQKKFGETIFKIGRQEIDTPWAFSETQNALANSFNGVVMQNKSLDNITLVGAWIGSVNDHRSLGKFQKIGANPELNKAGAVDGAFMGALIHDDQKTGSKTGAYVYEIPRIGTAFWLDGTKTLDSNLSFSTQMAYFTFNSNLSKADDTFGITVGTSYTIVDGTTLSLFGGMNTGKSESHTIANVGTVHSTDIIGQQTKLSTATLLGDGDVAGATDTKSLKLKLEQQLGEKGQGGTLVVQAGGFMHGENSSVNSQFRGHTASEADLIYKLNYENMEFLSAYIYASKINNIVTDPNYGTHVVKLIGRVHF
jgi:hypothetical protein